MAEPVLVEGIGGDVMSACLEHEVFAKARHPGSFAGMH